MARGPASCHWPRMVFNGLQPRMLQNIFKWPQVFPAFPMGFNRFPRKKKDRLDWGAELPCLHTFRKAYVAIGSCQWCPPKSRHFQVQYPYPIIHFQHLALIHASFWGVAPPSSHTFLTKSEGVNTPYVHTLSKMYDSPPLLLNQSGSGIQNLNLFHSTRFLPFFVQ